jgi:hypothetical protein
MRKEGSSLPQVVSQSRQLETQDIVGATYLSSLLLTNGLASCHCHAQRVIQTPMSSILAKQMRRYQLLHVLQVTWPWKLRCFRHYCLADSKVENGTIMNFVNWCFEGTTPASRKFACGVNLFGRGALWTSKVEAESRFFYDTQNSKSREVNRERKTMIRR